MVDVLNRKIADEGGPGPSRSDPLDRARAAADIIEREAAAIEENADLTPAVCDALRQSGLFWMGLPSRLGGDDTDLATALEVMEEIARADGSTGWSFFCNVVATAGAYANSTDSALTKLFGQDGLAVLCGQFAPVGRAVPVDGGYRVSGKHQFASGSANASWMAAGQMVYDESGAPLLGEDGKPLSSVCYFPKEKIRLTGNWDVAGLNGTGSVDYEIPEQFVPTEFCVSSAILTAEGASLAKRGGSLCQVGNFVMGNVGHSAVALGMAKRALQEIVRITGSKRRMGSPDTISQSDLFRYDFALFEARYWQARGYLFKVAQDVEQSRKNGQNISDEQQARILQMNHSSHRTAKEIIDFCNSWAGSAGVRNPSVIARIVRDISVAINHYIVDRSYVLTAAPALIEKWRMS